MSVYIHLTIVLIVYMDIIKQKAIIVKNVLKIVFNVRERVIVLSVLMVII